MLKRGLRRDNDIVDDKTDAEFERKIVRAAAEIITSNLARNQFCHCKIRVE